MGRWQLRVLAVVFLVAFVVDHVSTSCSPDFACNTNEEFNTCSNALCRAQLCSQIGKSVGCPAVAYCERSCVCKEGYLRQNNGDCVPEAQCDKPPKKPQPKLKPQNNATATATAPATATTTSGYASAAN